MRFVPVLLAAATVAATLALPGAARAEQYCGGRLTITNPEIRGAQPGSPGRRAFTAKYVTANNGQPVPVTMRFDTPPGMTSPVQNTRRDFSGNGDLALAIGAPPEPPVIRASDILSRLRVDCH